MKTGLARFTVRGFRNFAESITLDFTDIHDYAFNTECVDDGILMKVDI